MLLKHWKSVWPGRIILIAFLWCKVRDRPYLQWSHTHTECDLPGNNFISHAVYCKLLNSQVHTIESLQDFSSNPISCPNWTFWQLAVPALPAQALSSNSPGSCLSTETYKPLLAFRTFTHLKDPSDWQIVEHLLNKQERCMSDTKWHACGSRAGQWMTVIISWTVRQPCY